MVARLQNSRGVANANTQVCGVYPPLGRGVNHISTLKMATDSYQCVLQNKGRAFGPSCTVICGVNCERETQVFRAELPHGQHKHRAWGEAPAGGQTRGTNNSVALRKSGPLKLQYNHLPRAH